jgi:hypothetical protein
VNQTYKASAIYRLNSASTAPAATAAAAVAAGRRLQGQNKTLTKPARFSPTQARTVSSKKGVTTSRYCISGMDTLPLPAVTSARACYLPTRFGTGPHGRNGTHTVSSCEDILYMSSDWLLKSDNRERIHKSYFTYFTDKKLG